MAAYVQHRLQLECGEGAPRGEASRIAKATGFSTAHVANAKNHGTVGADFAEAMAAHWGMTLDGLRAAASEWGSATGFRADAGTPAGDARRLRDLPSWPAAAERARLAVDELDAPLVDEVGGFVPPAPIERVTVAFVTALVGAWKGVRPVGDLPPLARPTTFASPAVGEARSVGAEEEGKSGKAKRKK